MNAVAASRLHVHGRVVGASDQTSETIEIRGRGAAPPYVPRRNGHEALMFPGTDESGEHLHNHESTRG
jgi:hypothetical protein